MIFDFRSQKQKEEDAFKFKNKIYQLGDDQLKWEEAVFNELFASKKRSIPVFRFAAITHRQDELDECFNQKEWQKTLKRMNIKDDEIRIIELICQIENNAQSIEDLPTAQQILDMLNQGE